MSGRCRCTVCCEIAGGVCFYLLPSIHHCAMLEIHPSFFRLTTLYAVSALSAIYQTLFHYCCFPSQFGLSTLVCSLPVKGIIHLKMKTLIIYSPLCYSKTECSVEHKICSSWSFFPYSDRSSSKRKRIL